MANVDDWFQSYKEILKWKVCRHRINKFRFFVPSISTFEGTPLQYRNIRLHLPHYFV